MAEYDSHEERAAMDTCTALCMQHFPGERGGTPEAPPLGERLGNTNGC